MQLSPLEKGVYKMYPLCHMQKHSNRWNESFMLYGWWDLRHFGSQLLVPIYPRLIRSQHLLIRNYFMTSVK